MIGIGFQKIAAEKGVAPSRVLLLKDGDVGWKGISLTLDAEGAANLIRVFREHGADIPIDYHHATHKTEQGVKAPAAGWIKGLAYVPGEGLYATVSWTDQARAEIESEQYKYLSPVVGADQETERIFQLASVALTNKPRTINAKELLAAEQLLAELHVNPDQIALASLFAQVQKMGAVLEEAATLSEIVTAALELLQRTTAAERGSGDTLMSKKTKAAEMRRPIAWRKMVKGEEIVPGIDVEVEALPEEQVTELDEVGDAIMKLGEALRASGAELADDADAMAIVAMAIDVVAGAAPEETEAPAELAESVGLKKGATLKQIYGEINKLNVTAGAGKTMSERMAILEGELKDRNEQDAASRAETLVSAEIERGNINPNDTKQMEYATKLAETDPDSFTGIFEHMSPPVFTKRNVTAGAGGKRPTTERQLIIAEAGKEWEDNPEKRLGNGKDSWVNAALDDEREHKLDKGELEKLGV